MPAASRTAARPWSFCIWQESPAHLLRTITVTLEGAARSAPLANALDCGMPIDDGPLNVGGIRTPPVDAPVDVLSGAPGPKPDLLCLLMGYTTPLPAELYSSRHDYQRRYEGAADEAIARGFVLEDDRDALLAFADPSRIPD